jgi:hypothetical protein
VPSFLESAPTVMKEQDAVESFVSGLAASSDLMALAHVCSVMVCLALEEHLRREGKDNHAATFLEVARYLESGRLSFRRCGGTSRAGRLARESRAATGGQSVTASDLELSTAVSATGRGTHRDARRPPDGSPMSAGAGPADEGR